MTIFNYSPEPSMAPPDSIPQIVHRNWDAVTDNENRTPYVLATPQDIMENRRAQKTLRKSEVKFRDMAEKSMAGIYLIQDDLFRYVNSQFAQILGYGIEEIIDRLSPRDVIHHEDLPAVEESLRKRISGEINSKRYRLRMRTKSGQTRHAEIHSSRTLYRGRPAVIGSLLDHTDRMRTEEQLKRLSIAIEQVTDEIIITDLEGKIQYVNRAFEKTTGYSREEAIGNAWDFLRSGNPDPALQEKLRETIQGGKTWKGQITNRRKDSRLIQQDVTINPLFNDSGKITGYISLKRDVTESLRLEDQLRQAQKMEAVGTLAGGIAHDFNNILGAIMGYAELAKFKTADIHIQPYLEQMLTACHRSKELIKQILTFCRQESLEKKPVTVAPLVKETVKMLRASFPSTIEIRLEITNPNDRILADPTQLHQVIMNLCTNALHAMEKRTGVLEIHLERCDVSTGGRLYDTDWKEGSYLKMTVTDDGQGINPSIKDKIFDPFFTTRKAGEGTGLGLSVVYGIVKNHGGFISVESEMGRGTSFSVHLPLIDWEEEDDRKDCLPWPTGKGTILLVEDEEPLASLGREILTSLGYDVSVRFNGQDALQAFRADPCRYDLVITDMTMPKMTGATLSAEMLKIRPELPIILTTGSSERISEEDAKKIGIREYILKPVSLDKLAQVIRGTLDRKAPPPRSRRIG
ncbi:MAG: PAS domain S-box protein [Candidatus Aminicenantes bacterium]|nr:PAS domain S-box protein [Candidatus Aminicenantes bacterium]